MEDDEVRDEPPSKRLKTSRSIDPKGAETPAMSALETSRKTDDLVFEKESKVGITAFVSDSGTAFHGLVKRRYADFLVNEVLPNGRILHLRKTAVVRENDGHDIGGKIEHVSTVDDAAFIDTSVKLEEPPPTINSNPAEHAVNGTGAVLDHFNDEKLSGETISPEDKAKLISHLNERTVTELLDLYASILTNPTKKLKEHPTVESEFTSDRTLRAHIHQDIRRIFNSKIESTTTHAGILVLQAAMSRSNAHANKPKRNKLSWQERGGEHCHFTLYKENKDTMEAIATLARFLKMNPKELSFAGTKDRRAVTVQRLSARRVDAERLAALNKPLRMAAVGDFEYAPHEVRLGDLEGNEFTITVRECDVDGAADTTIADKAERIRQYLTTAMSDLHMEGFINYFGLQRFGTFATRSDVVGLKLLRGDFEGACNSILEYHPSALANADAADDDDDVAPGSGPSHVGREDRARAEAIKHFRATGRVNESLNMMPKRFSAESALMRHLGRHPKDFLGAVLGIQHGMRTMYVHSYQSMVWNVAASERWRMYGQRVVEGDLVLVREHRDKEAKAEREEMIDADGEVVVQAEGENRAKMADEVFERARELSKLEVESGRYGIWDVVLPQPGFDVLYPANASGEFYKTFMGSESGGGLDPGDMRRKHRDFSLPGAYRKLLARISGDWEVDVRRYERDEEQFVMTDLERIKAQPGEPREGTISEVKADEGSKIAAVLKFQLGTSQYATMALRELSKGGVREYKPEFSGGR